MEFFLLALNMLFLEICQNAFLRTKPALNPSSAGVVLCGHKQMAEVCNSLFSIKCGVVDIFFWLIWLTSFKNYSFCLQ